MFSVFEFQISNSLYSLVFKLRLHQARMISALKAEEASQMQLVEREEMDEDDDLFEAIDKLIAQGINAGDVKKLQEAGIHTCNGLMMHTKKNLTGIKGLSEAKVDKICEAAEKIVVELKPQPSLRLLGNLGLGKLS